MKWLGHNPGCPSKAQTIYPHADANQGVLVAEREVGDRGGGAHVPLLPL